ncbi:uncharacterized protein BKA78DRAFT_310955 [Phyllosticta capitalensis]|uniref:uncharacterized protein n=1 Tax=Phyllosticta capitalensis TaxID=121624 RepID=UPI0031312D41
MANGGNATDLGTVQVVQDAVGNVDVISIRHQQSIESCLRLVGYVCSSASLQFEGSCHDSLAMLILHDSLDRSINVALQTIHGGPDVFLDLQELVDAHAEGFGLSILDDGVLTRLCLYKDSCPALQLRKFPHQAINDMFDRQANLQNHLELAGNDFLDQPGQPLAVPSVGLHCFLEYFMQHRTNHGRLTGVACSLDSILQDGFAHTAEGIADRGCRNQMVRMQDEHVVIIVDRAFSSG